MLSYNHEHLAWKQRVRREIVTSNDFYDYFQAEQENFEKNSQVSRSSARTSSLPSTRKALNKIKELEAELQFEKIQTMEIQEKLLIRNKLKSEF